MDIDLVIQNQQSRSSYIKKMYNDIKEAAVVAFEIAALQSKLDLLEFYWAEFEETHENIVNNSSKYENLLKNEYFTKKLFDATFEWYHEARIELHQLSDQVGGVNRNDTRRRNSTLNHSIESSRYLLPSIPLPKFSGMFSEWRSFRELFFALTGPNSGLEDVERMNYLSTCLSEEPARLISHLAITNDSYEIAWNLLTSRYENKWLLVSAQLEILLQPAPMSSHSLKELDQLMSSVIGALSALKALDQPTEHWDILIVYIVVSRLHSKLREAWEYEIEASTEYPSKEQLFKFLRDRACAMKSIEMMAQKPLSYTSSNRSQPKPPAQPPSQVQQTSNISQMHSTKKASWTEMENYRCSYCNGKHYIVSCCGFRSLTPIARKEVVKKKHLCSNCLGIHEVHNCRTETRCRVVKSDGKVCGKQHHSLLHLVSRSAAPQNN